MTAVSDADLWGEAPPAEEDVSDLMVDLPAGLRERAVFVVDNEGAAAWVVDKLLSYDERAARLKEQFLGMMKAIEGDKARFERRFMAELEAWYDEQPKRGKTLALLTGTLAKRTVPAAPEVQDEEAAVEWAQEHLPGAVKVVTTAKLDGKLLRDYVKSTGEVVPGVAWREERESFKVSGLRPAKEA